MSAPIIRAEALRKTYYPSETRSPLVHAVRRISLTVDRGEFIAIRGPSGSGKSTLMHMLGSLDRPTSGRLWFDGEDITEATNERLAVLRNRNVGFVFQRFQLLPRATVLENVELPFLYRRTTGRDQRSICLDALHAVGLTHRCAHPPNALSGGEQQRVAIARALAQDPRVILADEPTGALDSDTGCQIMDLLSSLNRAGRTIIVVTHEAQVARFARRVLTLRDGQLVADTGSRALFA